MPCSKYKNGQRRLCYATKGWKDWSNVKKRGLAAASKETRRQVARKGGKAKRKQR